jgi:hypothetical protein
LTRRHRHRLIDGALDFTHETVAAEPFCVLPDSGLIPCGARRALQTLGQGVLAWFHQYARFSVDYSFKRAAAAEGDHWAAACLRLEGHDPEVFFAREDGRN